MGTLGTAMKMLWWADGFGMGYPLMVHCNALLPLACMYFGFMSDTSIADPLSRLGVLRGCVL